jgi:hypothetical protein
MDFTESLASDRKRQGSAAVGRGLNVNWFRNLSFLSSIVTLSGYDYIIIMTMRFYPVCMLIGPARITHLPVQVPA